METPFLIDIKAKRAIINSKTLRCANLETLQSFTGEITRVIFRHTLKKRFHDDGLRGVIDALQNRTKSDTVVLEDFLINGKVKAIARKAVKFMDDNTIKLPGGRIRNHRLESIALVGRTRTSLIDILTNKRDALLFTIGTNRRELSLNGVAVPLIIGGETAIGRSFNGRHILLQEIQP